MRSKIQRAVELTERKYGSLSNPNVNWDLIDQALNDTGYNADKIKKSRVKHTKHHKLMRFCKSHVARDTNHKIITNDPVVAKFYKIYKETGSISKASIASNIPMNYLKPLHLTYRVYSWQVDGHVYNDDSKIHLVRYLAKNHIFGPHTTSRFNQAAYAYNKTPKIFDDHLGIAKINIKIRNVIYSPETHIVEGYISPKKKSLQ